MSLLWLTVFVGIIAVFVRTTVLTSLSISLSHGTNHSININLPNSDNVTPNHKIDTPIAPSERPVHTTTKSLSHEDYTVGWICPLEVEQVAALEMLDEEHARLPQPPTDHNVYSLGSIGGHNIVIAGLHLPGNNPAATVVTQMRMTFPNLRFGLLVGIGGGVPVKTDNGMIRLGDVVVSKPAGGHSGAIQYDHGKVETGHFKRTGALAPPPAVLLNAAQDLAAKRARSRSDPVVENIKRIDTDIRGLRKYKYPGAGDDHLYRPNYIHLEPGVSCDECGCDPAHRVPRDIDDEDEGDDLRVTVHMGTIASGEQVIKDSELRDRLAQEFGVFCFEMEAAGALADFPCIVIRGISDYCDSHKNDRWHGYAAAAAAAYARELFFHMPIDEVRRYVSSAMEEGIDRLNQRQDDKDRRDIANWLTLVDYDPQQSDYISRRQEGTGQWLLNSDEFQEWLNSSRRTLFCPGIPGAGKTVITSIVVDHLLTKFRNIANVGTVYLYCNYQRQHEQNLEDLLLSLLKQLAQEHPSVPVDVKNLYEFHKPKGKRPSFDEILKVLRSITGSYSRVFIIIDALDECHVSNKGFNRILSELFNLQVHAQVNLFTTSRFVPEITSQFEGCIWKEIRAKDDDVLRYINERISLLPQSRKSKYQDLQTAIRSEVLKAADGMFLLVQLYMDSLLSKPTRGDIKLALHNLPRGINGLDAMYEQAMKRIDGQEEDVRKLAKQVLSWITHAKRPLTTGELQHALAVRNSAAELDEDFVPEVEDLVSFCAGLVIVDEHSDIIRWVHYTTRDYFEQHWTRWVPQAQVDIASVCLTYLLFDAFATGFCNTDKEFEARLRLNPLYDYAAQNWGHHARAASSEVEELILDLLESEAKVSSSSQAMLASKRYPADSGYSHRVPRQITGMHLAAHFGLKEAMIALLRNGHDLESKNDHGQTPLFWAVFRRHEAVVKLLLEKGAELEHKDNRGNTPLLFAAAIGHEAVVKLLLEKGAELEPKNNDGYTPLLWATHQGREAVVKLLLEKGAELEPKDNRGYTPLWWAAFIGHEAVVKLLLEKGAELESKGKDGTTPLYWAAFRGHEAIVKLLLDKGAELEKARNGESALVHAAMNGHEAVVKLLLEKGAPNKDTAIAKLFLKNGAELE